MLEVETPILSQATNADPNLASFPVGDSLYLQTSPEFPMKRLLATGSGSIYQITKSFRRSESGRFHNPEFTLLEWYRLDFGVQQLIDEVVDLLKHCFNLSLNIEVNTYSELFFNATDIDPHTAGVDELQQYASDKGSPEAVTICGRRHSDWLDYIFSQYIQPTLDKDTLYFVTDYPACMAMLAKLSDEDIPKAKRFEVYYRQLELANGYEELTDANIQRARFEADQLCRKGQGLEAVPMDQRLLAALEHGLPSCSGVALGLDRLLMSMTNASSIDEVLSFPIQRA